MRRDLVVRLFHGLLAVAGIAALAIPPFLLHTIEAAEPIVQLSPSTAGARQPSANCWAVIVGVSLYQSAYIPNLSYADDDATALYSKLSSSWGGSHLRLLTNAQATKANIQSAILSWLDPLEDSDDTVLFFFSGHGSQADFDQSPVDESDGMDESICPYDTSAYDWTYDIFDDELTSWLSNLESGRQMVILDTCRSGGFITKSSRVACDNSARDPTDGYTKDLSKSGRIILTASAENEDSYETSALGHGVFSYYVLDAFDNLQVADANNNHEISAEEIFGYARPRTTSYEPTQHPQIYDGYAGELPLVSRAILTIDSDPRVTSVTLDGEIHSASESPISVDFIAGTSRTFTFSVLPLIASGEQQPKHTFISWNDNVTSSSRTVTINQTTSYSAEYRTEYYLTVESERGNPQGAGWYDQGATAQFSADSPVNGTDGIRYVFAGWIRGSSGDTITSNTSTSSIVMDSPKTISAFWGTQYRLTVKSTPPDIASLANDYWYDQGATATTATASTTIDGGPGTRYVFSSWSVDGQLVSGNPTSLQMNSPRKAVAVYTTQYELTVLSDRGETQGSGWYNAGSEANISVKSSSGFVIRRVFSGWSGDSSEETKDATVLMDGSKTVEALWRTDYTQLYILIAGVLVVVGLLAVLILVWRKGHSLRDLPEYLSDRLDT